MSGSAPAAEAKDSAVDVALRKLRALKAANAPQEEVKAAVEHYIALKDGKPKNGALEAAANTIKSLKAALAPQHDVQVAVNIYVALRDGKPIPPVALAAQKVWSLKSSNASREEVTAAVAQYVALRDGKPDPKAIEAAIDLIKSLKARGASQEEVQEAVEMYVAIRDGKPVPATSVAAQKVRALKAACAPREEVEAAVAHYRALRNAKSESKSETRVCVLQVIPAYVFRTSSPLILGVRVLEGTVKVGITLRVPDKAHLVIGKIGSLQKGEDSISEAKPGEEVAVRIDAPESGPAVVFERDFDAQNLLQGFH